MQNVKVTVNEKATKMTIEVDLTADTQPSASGKTAVIASSRGNHEVADGIFLGLNCYKYVEPKTKAVKK